MRLLSLIEGKRDGAELSPDEMGRMVDTYLSGELADYQFSAFLMACCIRGLSISETVALTLAMVRSGEVIDLSGLSPVVDKHSTGGVGDKTTLVVAPLVSSLGVRVAKLSGRGLGHTGGTLDKLESIPGMRTDLSIAELRDQASRIGVAVSGQTADLVPADKRIYALRDVTGTVPSVGLIAASIMSKKIAGGADAVILDVKYGSGAFMKSREAASELALMMTGIGESVGLPTRTLLTTMDDILGRAVGNALEVGEAIDVLRGQGPADAREICLELAVEMLLASGLYGDGESDSRSVSSARVDAERALDDGTALKRFAEWVAAQGGDARVIEAPDELLPHARVKASATAPTSGVITAVDVELIGRVSVTLGAGRAQLGDAIDHGAGIVALRKLGDHVTAGQAMAEVHASEGALAEAGAAELASAWVISG